MCARRFGIPYAPLSRWYVNRERFELGLSTLDGDRYGKCDGKDVGGNRYAWVVELEDCGERGKGESAIWRGGDGVRGWLEGCVCGVLWVVDELGGGPPGCREDATGDGRA